MDVQTLEKLVIEIEAKTDKLELQLKQLNKIYDKAPKPKIDFDDNLGRKKLSELEGYYNKLKSRLEAKIKANVDVAGIQEAQTRLNKVGQVMDSIKGHSGGTTENLSRWGMIITGLNQGIELIRNSFSEVKNLIGESIKKANELAETKSYFKGSAGDMEAFRLAAKGTVDDQALIQLSNKATDLNINIKEQILLFALAKRAQEQYGGSFEENMDRIILASDGMTKGLRAIGVSTIAYKKSLSELAQQQGGRINDLDADTQKTLRLKALIKASGMTMGEATNATKSNADEWESWGVSINNQKRNLGDLLSKGLTPILRAFDDGNKSPKDWATALIGVGGVIIELIPSFVSLITMQKLFGLASLTTAGQIDVATGSLVAFDVAAKGSTLTKILGWAGGIVAGAGAAALLIKQFQWMSNPGASPMPKWMTTPGASNNYKGKGFVSFGEHEKSINPDSEAAVNKVTAAWSLAGKTIPQVQQHILDLRKKQATLDQDNDSLEYKQIDKQIKNAELQLQTLQLAKEAADKKKEILKSYYEEVKFSDDNYYAYLAKNMAEQIKKFRANGVTETQIEKYKVAEKKKIQDEYFAYLTNLLKKYTGEEVYKFDENGQINIPAGAGPQVPRNMQNVKAGEKSSWNVTSSEDKAPSEEKILTDWVHQSELATSAYNVFFDSVMSGFDEMQIKASETAGATTRFFVNMGNMIIQEVERILIKWALLNVISSFAGGGGVNILTMLGIKAHDGGSFLGTNSGIRKLAGGGSFIVPPGFNNDTYPLMVESGEYVNVTPRNQVNLNGKSGSQERLLHQLIDQQRVTNFHLAQSSTKKTSDNSSIPISGELGNDVIYLSNKKASRQQSRYRGTV